MRGCSRKNGLQDTERLRFRWKALEDLERAILIFEMRPDLVFATVQQDFDLSSADGLTMARVMIAFANKAKIPSIGDRIDF